MSSTPSRPAAPRTLADAQAAVQARYPGATLIPDPEVVDEDGWPDPTGGVYATSTMQAILTGLGYHPEQVAAVLADRADPAHPGSIQVRQLPDAVTALAATADHDLADDLVDDPAVYTLPADELVDEDGDDFGA